MESKTSLHRTRLHKTLLEFDEPAQALEPRRVLFVSSAGEMGGAERSLYELLRALPRDSFEPHVCVPVASRFARLLDAAGIPVHEVPLRRFRRSTHLINLAGNVRALYQGSRQVADVCRRERIELLHANTNSAALVAWEVGRTTALPFIWHCRDLSPLYGLARILGGAAAAVVAISEAVSRQLAREGVKPEKLKLIYNGIDLARIAPSELFADVRARARANLGIEARRPVLLTVGAYVPWKKHELFLETLALVRRRMPTAVGLLAGSDQFGENAAYVAQLRLTARRFSLNEDALKVLMERDDVPELMAASDVLVSCSENEPFGRVLAEAGASGLPVVSTRSGAKPEIVEDNVTGILTEPGDAEALTAACLRLLADPVLRQCMGRAAQARVASLFDVRRAAGELAALCESILQRQAAQERG